MERLLIILAIVFLFSSCSTSRLVDEFVNTESINFQSSKVLIIALTPNEDLKKQFEYKLMKALESKSVIAIRSVDYVESNLNVKNQTEKDLKNIEKELLTAGFDAVLFSKLVGQQNRVSLSQSYRNLSKSFESFSDYYYENRPVYNSQEIEKYPVYNTETSLYCLCPGEESDLIWRGQIDIVNPSGVQSTIIDYVKTLMRTFKKNKILVVNKNNS